LNYFANVIVGRWLGPTDYSIFAVLLSLYTTLAALTGIIQITVTNSTARLAALQDWQMLRGLLHQMIVWLAIAGTTISVITALGAVHLGNLFHISTPAPVLALAAAMTPLAMAPLAMGILQGRERFGAFGMAYIVGAISRLASSLALMGLGAGVTGAVISLAFAPLGTIAVAVFSLPDIWQNWRERSNPHLGNLGVLFKSTTIGILSYALLTGMDILVVKNRFLPIEAGLYASISTVGKISLWIPASLSAFLLPKASAQFARGNKPVALLRGTQLAALAICGCMCIVFFGWSGTVMHVLYGSQFMAFARLLGPYGLVMAMYALVGIWFNYFLASGETRYTWALVIAVIIQATVMVLVCQTMSQMLGAMLATGIGLVIYGEYTLRWHS
jgi:O-antigen/teichoic acid export membrane protein